MTLRTRHPQFTAFVATLALSTGLAAAVLQPRLAVMTGFDLAALLYIALAMLAAARGSPAAIRRRAAANDAGRELLLVTAGAVSVVVMLAVGLEAAHPPERSALTLAVSAGTLVLVWLFANLVFAQHYAHMFYDERTGRDRGGLLFPGGEEPDGWDFCYFALVIGATFQVSDVQVTSRCIRRVVMAHGLCAFFFSIGVLALTVNILGGLL